MGWGSGVALSCGVGRRLGWDPGWLWLWRRPAATALIRPLAWEPPYALGVTLKSEKKKKEKRGIHILKKKLIMPDSESWKQLPWEGK